MRPGREKPSVVIETIGEIDLFKSAVEHVAERLPDELYLPACNLLPQFSHLMFVHEGILPQAAAKGTENVKTAEFSIDEDQVAILSLFLFAAAKSREDKKDELVRQAYRSAMTDLNDNLQVSKNLLGIA